MQNYRKILNASDYEELYDFYKKIKPSDLPQMVKNATRYLNESYRKAKEAGFQDCEHLDISEYTEFLDDLYWCAVTMLDFKERSLILESPKEGVKVNVYPFLDFIQSNGNIKSLVDSIVSLKRVVLNYLDGENTKDCKSIFMLMEHIEYLFDRISDNHK